MKHKRIFQTIIEYSRPQIPRIFGSAVITAIVILVGDFIGPLSMARILELLQAGNSSMSDYWPHIIFFAITQIVSLIGWRLVNVLIWRGESIIKRDAYVHVFDKLIAHSVKFHADHFGGSLVSQANKFTSAIESFWDTIVFSVVQLLVSFASAIIILGFKFWPYAVVLAFTIILFIVATIIFSRKMPENNINETKATNKISGHLSDVVTNILTLKAYSGEAREKEVARDRAENWYQASMKVMTDVNRMMLVSSVITNAIRIASIVIAVIAQQRGLISLGTILLMVTYTGTITARLHEVRQIIRNYNHIIGDATEMVKILDEPIEVQDRSKESLEVTKGEIEFKDVVFSHNKKLKLFENFNLKIEPGQKVGLVGQSGSGKSSLASLMMRFYDIDSGEILIDGTNIANVTQASLRQSMAYVPQEPMMFHRSVSDNIAFGKTSASLAEIKTAAKQACADDFINKLPDKYNTMVGERGTKLSGGQRQRIAIARAIIKDAPILVLDEATSALDSESEKLIQDAMDELMIGRTSLVVAHRLSTIAKLDRIIVLDNGKIVEDGSHEELLKQNGEYTKLWARQSGGFLTTDANEHDEHISETAPDTV